MNANRARKRPSFKSELPETKLAEEQKWAPYLMLEGYISLIQLV